jgi:hypothetical protein
MLVFFTALSLYFVINILKSGKIKNINFLGVGTSTLLGLYTNHLFVFIALANLILLISPVITRDLKKSLKKNKIYLIKSMLTYLFCGILYLPWFMILLKQLRTVSEEGFWLQFNPILSPVKLFFQSFSGVEIFLLNIPILIWIAIGISYIIPPFLFVVSTVENVRLRINRLYNILILWLVLVCLFVWLYSFKTAFMYIRYLIFIVPVVLIIVSNGALILKKKNKALFAVIVILCVVSQISISAFNSYNLDRSKAKMTHLIQDIEYKNGDLILHSRAYTHHAFNIYSHLDDLIYNPYDDLPYYEGLAVINDSDFYKKRDIRDAERVWIIYLWGIRDSLTNALQENYVLQDSKHYDGDLHLELWTKLE